MDLGYLCPCLRLLFAATHPAISNPLDNPSDKLTRRQGTQDGLVLYHAYLYLGYVPDFERGLLIPF
jgi:hypothetical protein